MSIQSTLQQCSFRGLVRFNEVNAEPELRRMVVLAIGLAASMRVILSARYRTHEKENAALLSYSNVLCIPAISLFIELKG